MKESPKSDQRTGRGPLLEGKVAIVTGIAGGLGRSIEEAFLEAGAIVVGCDIVSPEREHGDATAGAFAITDVSCEAQVSKLVDDVVAGHGKLDIFVNNAAVSVEHELLHTTEEELDQVLGVNLKGVFFGTKHAVRAMKAGGGGSIVNMASILGLVGDGMLAAYCAAKGGVLGLTRAAAVQYARDGIRCNAICPGDIETPLLVQYLASFADPVKARAEIEEQYPGRRVAQPSEVAQTVVFLASEQSAFVNGQALVVDGGMTVSCYRA